MKVFSLQIALLCSLFFFSCDQVGIKKTDYEELSATTEKGVNVVVEIPAGTSHKIEYNKATRQFENDLINGQTRVIDFLPYPGNYGFIPATMMDLEKGGDGDPLDILVICESLPTGTVIDSKPIAALLLKDGGELDTKIIAVPVDSSLQVIAPQDFQEFLIKYDPAKKIIEDWFLSYKGLGKTEFLGWRDDQYAWDEINKWKK